MWAGTSDGTGSGDGSGDEMGAGCGAGTGAWVKDVGEAKVLPSDGADVDEDDVNESDNCPGRS